MSSTGPVDPRKRSYSSLHQGSEENANKTSPLSNSGTRHVAPNSHAEEVDKEVEMIEAISSTPNNGVAQVNMEGQERNFSTCMHYTSVGPAYLTTGVPLPSIPPTPPPSYSSLLSSGSLCRTWPFELDEFQQKSIENLENNQHLLVAAHTSAGKTVVAEYAIAMVFKKNKLEREKNNKKNNGVFDANVITPQRRVIYTAPIKALSNQKYREFKEIFTNEYEDVGLLTGDVMLNPSASLIIMTTEILRHMLYNGNELLNSTSVVIFDEIHYMRDIERGIIWEESIILLPPEIQCVFLSATLSNSEEFAEWIHSTKATRRNANMKNSSRTSNGMMEQAVAAVASVEDSLINNSVLSSSSTSSLYVSPQSVEYSRATCHVIYTNKRPVPLKHFLFLKGGGQGLYQIKNDEVNLNNTTSSSSSAAPSSSSVITSSFRKIYSELQSQALAKLQSSSSFASLLKQQQSLSNSSQSSTASLSAQIQSQLSANRAAKRAQLPDIIRLLSLCVEQDWLPVIVFSFSRRECEGLSLQANDKKFSLNLTSDDEKKMITLVWEKALEVLADCDRSLPQLSYIFPLLLKGIAVHHSGLLPILKELIEILFQEGLVKCLFATETFAMGLNMPSRCLKVGTLVAKADGSQCPVEELIVGDLLVGTDEDVRVLKVFPGSCNIMFQIGDSLGRKFVVTPEHRCTVSWRVGPSSDTSFIHYYNRHFQYISIPSTPDIPESEILSDALRQGDIVDIPAQTLFTIFNQNLVLNVSVCLKQAYLVNNHTSTLTEKEEVDFENAYLTPIVSVEMIVGQQEFVGIEVDRDSRFALASGILTHNSTIFTSLSKFDGRVNRFLQSGEYTQMAGRAGRRGVDQKGIVIMMVGESDLIAKDAQEEKKKQLTVAATPGASADPPSECGGLIQSLLLRGRGDPLTSKFRLTYNMLLNLIRSSSSFDPTYILSNSFLHFQQKNQIFFRNGNSVVPDIVSSPSPATTPVSSVADRRSRMGYGGISSASAPSLLSNRSSAISALKEAHLSLKQVESEISALSLTMQQRTDLLSYQSDYDVYSQLQHQRYEYDLRHPLHSLLPFLQSGRLVFVTQPKVAAMNTTAFVEGRSEVAAVEWGWGIVVNWRKRHSGTKYEWNSIEASSEVDLPAIFNPSEYVVDILLPIAGSSATDEKGMITTIEEISRWGDISIPLPRPDSSGPQVWENGRLNLMRSGDLEEINAGAQGALASSISSLTSLPGGPAVAPYHIVLCSLNMIHSISSVRIYLPPSLLSSAASSSLSSSPASLAAQSAASSQSQLTRHALFLVTERCQQNFLHLDFPKINPLDYLSDISKGEIIADVEGPFKNTVVQKKWLEEWSEMEIVGKKLVQIQTKLSSSPVHSVPLSTIQSFFRLHSDLAKYRANITSSSSSIELSHLTSYRIELSTRLRILKRFKHLNASGLITSKGRIGAEMECTDELCITEFIFNGEWKELTVIEFVSFLSVFIEVEKSNADKLSIPTQSLKKCYTALRSIAENIVQVSNECGLVLDNEKYLSAFKSDLIPIIFAWLNLAPVNPSLSSILQMSNLFEGTLVRVMRRLDELIQQLVKAATNIGEKDLLQKLTDGQILLKKGIVFTNSLYI